MSVAIELWCETNVGGREQNEDAFVCLPESAGFGQVIGVFDGMGGAAAGEQASSIATDTLSERYPLERANGLSATEALVASLTTASQRIRATARETPDWAGMGTTAVAVAIDRGSLSWAHCGDSRLYLFGGDRLEAATRDHSKVAELIAQGWLTEDQAEGHPASNVITRALGRERDTVEAGAGSVALAGTSLLMCTDGLHGVVPRRIMEDVVRHLPAREGCELLIELAKALGTDDNVTVAIVHGRPVDPTVSASAIRQRALAGEGPRALAISGTAVAGGPSTGTTRPVSAPTELRDTATAPPAVAPVRQAPSRLPLLGLIGTLLAIAAAMLAWRGCASEVGALGGSSTDRDAAPDATTTGLDADAEPNPATADSDGSGHNQGTPPSEGVYCGDRFCRPSERCGPEDRCIKSCGDGDCAASENCESCADDCGCGDGEFCQQGECREQPNTCGNQRCDSADGENCRSCASDCPCGPGKSCSRDGCVDACGDGTCDGASEDCESCSADCPCGPARHCTDGQCLSVAATGVNHTDPAAAGGPTAQDDDPSGTDVAEGSSSEEAAPAPTPSPADGGAPPLDTSP